MLSRFLNLLLEFYNFRKQNFNKMYIIYLSRPLYPYKHDIEEYKK